MTHGPTVTQPSGHGDTTSGDTLRTRPSIKLLTSLRFFAALIVVLFHYTLGQTENFFTTGGYGYQAVTFFFVLSGFILVYAHGRLDGQLNVTQAIFFKARLLRICPVYYLAIVLIALLFILAGILQRITPAEIILVLTMLQSWTPPFALAINPPAWSLSNELLFYLLFPAIWRLSGRIGFGASLAASICLLLLVSCGLMVFRPSEVESWHNFRAYFPLFNIPKFIFGMSLGHTFIAAPRSEQTHGALFLIGAIVLIVSRSSSTVLVNDLALSFGCGLIILGSAGAAGTVADFFSCHPLVILGKASYAIYILHFPIWLWWNHFTRIVYRNEWPLAFDLLMYIAIVLSISVTVFLWIESPARRVGSQH